MKQLNKNTRHLWNFTESQQGLYVDQPESTRFCWINCLAILDVLSGRLSHPSKADFILFLSFRLFQTLALWLDEPRLHDPSLFLQGLPPAYDAERLTKVLKRDEVLKTVFEGV
jgi:hypothetical protein